MDVTDREYREIRVEPVFCVELARASPAGVGVLICLQSFPVCEAELRQRGVSPTSRSTKRPKQRRRGSAARLTTLDVRCLTREPAVTIQYRRRKDEVRHITMF